MADLVTQQLTAFGSRIGVGGGQRNQFDVVGRASGVVFVEVAEIYAVFNGCCPVGGARGLED